MGATRAQPGMARELFLSNVVIFTYVLKRSRANSLEMYIEKNKTYKLRWSIQVVLITTLIIYVLNVSVMMIMTWQLSMKLLVSLKC